MLLGGAAAGLLSSVGAVFTDPYSLLKSPLLGLVLSSSVVALDHLSRRRLDAGEPPERGTMLAAALAGGLLAGLGCGLIDRLQPLGSPGHNEFFADIRVPFSLTAAAGVAYGLALHHAYWRRWGVPAPGFTKPGVLLRLCLGGILAGTFRLFLFAFYDTPGSSEAFVLFLYGGLLTGLPFAAFWGAALIALDPAWSYERWDRLSVWGEFRLY